MLGSIQSDQRCRVCGGRFRDNGTALVCPSHPREKATRFRVYFGRVGRRFTRYSDAAIFLGGLRLKTTEGVFDERDYKRDNPLGFTNLAEQWLKVRKGVKCFRNLRCHVGYAIQAWGNRNIKEIGYAELEDLLNSLEHLSGKSKANVRATLHAFWVWLRKRRVLTLDQMPEFPEVHYELGWRKTISKELQEGILEQIKAISWDFNPKIWVGCKWLTTYFSIRPIELIHIQEKDIRHDLGLVEIWYSKTGEPKAVPYLEEDLELAKSFGPALPHLYFFRHIKGNGGVRPGQQFGAKYLWKWWRRACQNLGIEGVDLYGGTRHSTVRALRKHRTPEEIRKASMHKTNKAFERYFRMELEDLRAIYQDTDEKKKGEIIELRRKPSAK